MSKTEDAVGPASEAPTSEDYAAAMAVYRRDGETRALALGNRGPARFDASGRLTSDILDAYWLHGFYVFTGLVAAEEIALLRREVENLLERAPVDDDATVDAQGRPAFGQSFRRPTYTLVAPLADPWGGTELLGGRHARRMIEPRPNAEAPEKVVYLMHGMCQTMASGLRLYGHPQLLAIAASINGDDFVPYNDATFVKPPGTGGSVAWHQDGVTHWDNPAWDEGIHGFNFQVQLYGATSATGLWVVPGTHKLGRIDIAARIDANGGCERLPDAVPLLCRPGDVTVVNRQALHASFANTTADPRVSLTFGFHRRASVLGAQGALSQAAREVYDANRIFERSRVIAVAIDARAQRYPKETRYGYAPFVGLEADYRFDDDTYEQIIRNYNLKDLSI